MITIDFNEIAGLGISPWQCVEWVRESFLKKSENRLPPKVSMHWGENIFFNTMPCHVVIENRICVKTVSRYPAESPTMKSELMLWNAENGSALALMDATWITTMRTGAVAALSAKTFINNNNGGGGGKYRLYRSWKHCARNIALFTRFLSASNQCLCA